MLEMDHLHDDTFSDSNKHPSKGRLHTHQAVLTTTSGTGSATILHEGTNDPDGVVGWTLICTLTFAAAASGATTSAVLEHSWERLRSRCTSISGTGALVRSLIAAQ